MHYCWILYIVALAILLSALVPSLGALVCFIIAVTPYALLIVLDRKRLIFLDTLLLFVAMAHLILVTLVIADADAQAGIAIFFWSVAAMLVSGCLAALKLLASIPNDSWWNQQ